MARIANDLRTEPVHTIRTVDCHVGGHVVRVVIDGMPRALGKGPSERAAWFRRHADNLRRSLVLEPRGHADVTLVALTEASSATAHAGLLFMDGRGYPRLSAGAVVAAAAVGLEQRLITTGAPDPQQQTLVFETAVGMVRARATLESGGAPSSQTPDAARHVTDVSLDLGPAFVHTASHGVRRGARMVPLDIAFGGDFFAIVDSEAAGVPTDRTHIEDMRRAGLELCAEVDKRFKLTHPLLGGAQELAGVVFTGPSSTEAAHLRGAVVSRHGVVDQSSLSGTAATMAVLDAMGLVTDGQAFVQEGVAGLMVRATVRGRTTVGELPAVELDVTARAWVIGEQVWRLHSDDPLRHGPIDT